MLWIDHLAPVQRSTSAFPCPLCPTAMHALADVHDTLPKPPPTAGVRWIDHRLPFHRSTRVFIGPGPPKDFPSPPTAVQALAEVHDTPDRKPSCPGLGVRWIDHLAPFQRSTNAVRALLTPMATQALADGHDTPEKISPPPAGPGFGMR